ncbi:helix-turn-helix transcriptional regulator [bacterium]|nr:helix-turn-helix transcriptional regulator [bacterium]
MQVNQSVKKKLQKHLGVNIKYHRTRLNITQENLSFDIGVDRSYITAIENGDKSPSLYCLYLLAKKFKIQLRDLLDINI